MFIILIMNKSGTWIAVIIILVLVLAGGFFYYQSQKSNPQTPVANPTVETTPPTITQTPTSSSSSTKIETVTVILDKDGFSPASVTITPGSKVIFVNSSGTDAAVNSDPHPTHTNYPPLNLGPIDPGQSKSLTFDTPGTYGYHNHLNPSQRGTIIVANQP